MVGKSICGSGETGSWPKGERPGERDADRQQRGGDRPANEQRGEAVAHGVSVATAPPTAPNAEAAADALEQQIDDRRREQGQHLADGESADDGEAERVAQLRADAGPEHQRQRAEHRRHRRHQDRPKPQQAGLIDRVARRSGPRCAAHRARNRSS